MLNGEVTAAYLWGAEAAAAAKENKDIKVFFPKEGMYIWQDNLVIPKGSVHKKNAELCINFLLDQEVSSEISKEFLYANPNVAAHEYIDKDTLNNNIIYPTKDDIDAGEHIKDIGDATKLYDKIWTELKSE